MKGIDMIAWFADNAATILGIAVVLFLVGAAVISLIRDSKRKGG